MIKQDLINFEMKVADLFEEKKIKGVVHLSGGNEDNLLEIFTKVNTEDWVFGTWRSHYHALLKGIPPELILNAILEGKSISLCFPEYKFYCSGILCGTLPIATGVAMAIKRRSLLNHVWVFLGDAAAELGSFYECVKFSEGHDLPITFIIEDNGVCVGEPTLRPWGKEVPTKWESTKVLHYKYELIYPHIGTNKWVNF